MKKIIKYSLLITSFIFQNTCYGNNYFSSINQDTQKQNTELIKSNDEVDLEATDIFGFTVLMKAIMAGKKNTVEELLKQGASTRINCLYHLAPIHQAAFEGKLEIVKLLLSYGARTNSYDMTGKNPLYWAASSGSLETVEFLIQEGGEVNHQDETGETALMIACQLGYTSIAKTLIDNGSFVSLKNQGGETALHRAASQGKEPCLKVLLKADKTVLHLGTEHGETALHKAINNNSIPCISTLLEAGADPFFREDITSLSAFDLAELNKNMDLLCLFVRWKSQVVQAKEKRIQELGNILFKQKLYLSKLSRILNVAPFTQLLASCLTVEESLAKTSDKLPEDHLKRLKIFNQLYNS